MYNQDYIDRARFMNPYAMQNNMTINDVARMLMDYGRNAYNSLRDLGGAYRMYRQGTPGFNNSFFQGGIVDDYDRLLD